MHSSACGNVPLNVGEVIGVASSAHSESRPDTVRGLPAFASMLRVHRTGAGLTQEELAAAAGISTRSVSDLERGITRTAHRDTVRLLVAALGLDGDEAAAFAAVARGRAPRPDVSSHTGSVSPPTNSGLPVPPTALVGRAAVIDDVLSVLHRADVRVLTVTGPGGVGKTRVVLELAARWARDTGERATFVPLAHLRDAGLVLPTVAEAVGVRASGSVPLLEMLVEHLHDRPSLLVLDNVEQLLGCAAELGAIVADCPLLTLLSSSRVALRVQGEHEVRLEPLAVPVATETTAAVELFLDRSAAVAPSWRPTPRDRVAVAELCRVVDGLPLAIELAAAWMRVLSPAELLARGQGTLRLLSRGARDAPERHRSLRAALGWSVELLGADAVALLRRLSVWSGGWTLDAAERVCGMDDVDVVEATAELVEANLVRAAAVGDGATRYSMLTVVREFAAELLAEAGEAAAVETGHTAEILEQVERAADALTGPGQVQALSALDMQNRNVQGALERCVRTADAGSGQRIAGALWRYWEMRGHLAEGRRWLERVLALPGASPHPARANALNAAGNLARDQGDADAARGHYREARELFQVVGATARVASIENNLANVALDAGDTATAERYYRNSLATFTAAGDRYHTALLSNNLALALRRRAVGEDEVVELLTQSIAGFQAIGDARGTARAVESMARVLNARGEHARALPLHTESLDLRRRAGDLNGRIYSIEGMAQSLAHLGRTRTAARLLGHAAALRDLEGDPRKDDDEVEVGSAVTAVIAAIGEPDLEHELLTGANWSLDRILSQDE